MRGVRRRWACSVGVYARVKRRREGFPWKAGRTLLCPFAPGKPKPIHSLTTNSPHRCTHTEAHTHRAHTQKPDGPSLALASFLCNRRDATAPTYPCLRSSSVIPSLPCDQRRHHTRTGRHNNHSFHTHPRPPPSHSHVPDGGTRDSSGPGRRTRMPFLRGAFALGRPDPFPRWQPTTEPRPPPHQRQQPLVASVVLAGATRAARRRNRGW